MRSKISPIINPSELLSIRHQSDLIIIDASNGKDVKANYESNHLDGAIFVDINTQLADIKEDLSLGGRHPLPTEKEFCKTLTSLGVSKSSHIVIYDDKNGANAAARFWWMLRAAGHENVQVLNGGIQAAIKAGFPSSSKVESIKSSSEPYFFTSWQLPISSMDEVEDNLHSQKLVVIDVREPERYNGIKEPIDLVAGHIPGAINIPFDGNLNSDGSFKSIEELRNKYQQLLNEKGQEHVIVHCGSGVTACHTLLAMDYSGLPIPKLYVGSWSEWSRNH